jgi:hypothetical protein
MLGGEGMGRRVVAAAALLVAVLLGGVCGVVAQGTQGSGVDESGKKILGHLNLVIQYYRTTKQPIQKAGEPNDVVYWDQATEISGQIAEYAFQSAKAQAAVVAGAGGAAASGANVQAGGEQQKVQTAETNVEGQVSDLKRRLANVEQQIAVAKAKNLAALQAQKKQLAAALELATAMQGALQKLVAMGGGPGGSALARDIDGLQSSVPELTSKNKTVTSLLTTIDSARSSGVTSQGVVLLDLLGTRHDLATLLNEEKVLHKQAQDLQTPLLAELKGLIHQGQALSQQVEAVPVATGGAAVGAPAAAVSGQPTLEGITAEFKELSAATVPLSAEMILLEQSRSNLLAWQTSVNQEYDSILHALLLRILVILIALGVILGGGEIWRQATNKYVQDIRRRRQLFLVRRVVVGFLSAIVVLFGFVTQFNSLATFAGFITAGIAVGLQTILLSVAAYFFIVGRYGIKVGDRITIAAVTGDVIDVGLVRFYMMELAGTGSELNPTGRVAMFSNAVLFQAGTPLYKQIPGTRIAWHELTVTLKDGADYKMICEAVMQEVNTVYEGHRVEIERQHKGVEDQMQLTMSMPSVESRLQLNGGLFQLWVRFPVQLEHASEMDEMLTEALVDLMAKRPEVKGGVASTPVIQPSVRG